MSCPVCSEERDLCPLCLADEEISHDEAKRAEGLRLALVFAERGAIPEVPDKELEEP